MVVKVKEIFERTGQFKNNDKTKKYILRGERNASYLDRILSNKKTHNFTAEVVYKKAYDISGKGSHPHPTSDTKHPIPTQSSTKSQYYKS